MEQAGTPRLAGDAAAARVRAAPPSRGLALRKKTQQQHLPLGRALAISIQAAAPIAHGGSTLPWPDPHAPAALGGGQAAGRRMRCRLSEPGGGRTQFDRAPCLHAGAVGAGGHGSVPGGGRRARAVPRLPPAVVQAGGMCVGYYWSGLMVIIHWTPVSRPIPSGVFLTPSPPTHIHIHRRPTTCWRSTTSSSPWPETRWSGT